MKRNMETFEARMGADLAEWLANLADHIGVSRNRLAGIMLSLVDEVDNRQREREGQVNEALIAALRATDGDEPRRRAVWIAHISRDPDAILEAAGLLPEEVDRE